MKKRMFLSTILMTLVLLLAVTTATFAWYGVTSTLDVVDPAAATHANISTQTNATAASLSVNVDLEITEASSTSELALVLAAHDAEDGWYSMFTSNGRDYPIEITAEQTPYKVFEVKAKLSGDAMANQEFMHLLTANTEILTVTAAVNNDSEKTTAAYKDAVKFWTIDGATLGTIAAPAATTTMDIAVNALTANYQIIGYVVMYLDGTAQCVNNLSGSVTIASAIKVTGAVAAAQ